MSFSPKSQSSEDFDSLRFGIFKIRIAGLHTAHEGIFEPGAGIIAAGQGPAGQILAGQVAFPTGTGITGRPCNRLALGFCGHCSAAEGRCGQEGRNQARHAYLDTASPVYAKLNKQ